MTDIRGARKVQLTVNGSDDHNPVFAPDGRMFYFSSNRGQAVDVTAQELRKYRELRRTVTFGGVEYPVASGRDIWRAELSEHLVKLTMSGKQPRQASAR